VRTLIAAFGLLLFVSALSAQTQLPSTDQKERDSEQPTTQHPFGEPTGAPPSPSTSAPAADSVDTITVTSLNQVEHRYGDGVAASIARGLAQTEDERNGCDARSDTCTKTKCTTIGISTTCSTSVSPTASASLRAYMGIATELTALDNSGQQQRFLILNDRVPVKFTVGRKYAISRDKKNQYLVSDDGKKWLIEPAK
jgi:hypothetical protein